LTVIIWAQIGKYCGRREKSLKGEKVIILPYDMQNSLPSLPVNGDCGLKNAAVITL
jgi:hypothetical protein